MGQVNSKSKQLAFDMQCRTDNSIVNSAGEELGMMLAHLGGAGAGARAGVCVSEARRLACYLIDEPPHALEGCTCRHRRGALTLPWPLGLWHSPSGVETVEWPSLPQ